MGNLLKTGATWLARQRSRHAASDVVYRRGTAFVTLPATRARAVAEMTDTYGKALKVFADDWIITAADLVLDNALTTPQDGDQIEADGILFDVRPFAGEPCYRNSDPQGASLRIHSKQHGTDVIA